MFKILVIIALFLIIIYILYTLFFRIDYSKRISKAWGLWSNREPYGIYEKHNRIEETLNPDMDRVIVGPNEVELYLDPELLKLYNSAPIPVMKSDILRLGVIYNRGGWYCDMDVKPLIPWTKIIKNYDIILFSEDDNKQYWGCPKEDTTHTLRIAYDLFYIKAKHPFISHVIKILKSRCQTNEFLKSKNACDIMYYTGPDMFTTAYHTYPKKNEIYIYFQQDYKNILEWGKKGDWGL